MNTKITCLLASACAIGVCGLAQAQTNQPSSNTAPLQTQYPQSDQSGAQPIPNATGQTMQGLPVDQQMTVSGVQVMCGGIGSDESDPRYANYPAKIEVAGGYGQWVGDNDISIAGAQNISAHCSGPWFMAQLPAGSYTISVTHGTATHTAHMSVAGNGNQHKIVVRFPELQRGKDDGEGPYTGQQQTNSVTPNSSSL